MPAGICKVVRENHGSKFAGRSRDDSTKIAKFWKKSLNGQATVVGGHTTVGRLSNNLFSTFQAIRKILGKCRWTVTRQWSEVTRLSADCQTTFFRRFEQFGKFLKKVAERLRNKGRRSRDRWMTVKQRFLTFQAIRDIFKKVAERSRDSGRRSRDCRPTVKQRFFAVSSNSEKFRKKSLNGHATVVGGPATVGRLSNNVFPTFQAIQKNFEKKLLNGHGTVVGGHATVGYLSNNVISTFQAIRKKKWKKSPNGHATVVGGPATVGRLSNKVFSTFQAIRKNYEKKSLNGHTIVVGGRGTVGWLSNNVFWRFKQFGEILKKVAERSRDSSRRSRNRRPTVKERFFVRSKQLEGILKKSLNGHATVVGGHTTVGRLSNNVFWTFQAIWNFFEKSHWTVTRQWSEVTRPSADCQTTFFGRFKQFEIFLKKVTERSRDSGRRSRDRHGTVKQRFLDVSSDLEIFWKKSLNGHATVVGGHATVGRLSNNVFWTFQAIWIFLKKVTERSRDSGRRSRDRRPTVKLRFFVRSKLLGGILKKVTERSRDSGRWSCDRRPTVKPRFLDVSSNLEIFWKKSPWNVQKTLFDSRPTVAWLPITVGWPFSDFFQKNFKLLETSKKRGLTVGRRSHDHRPLSRDRSVTFFKIPPNSLERTKKRNLTVGRRSRDLRPLSRDRSVTFFKKIQIAWNVQKTLFDSRPTVAWPPTTVAWPFSDFFQKISKSLETSKKRCLTVPWRSRDLRPLSRDRSVTFFKKISNWTVTRQWSEVTRPSADCQAHICMNKRERERGRERETISVTLHTGTAMLCRWPFHQPASRLRLALTRVVDRQGQLVYEYCESSHWQVEFVLCAICRSTFTRQFSRVLTPGPSSLDFSRESPAKDMWCYVACVYNGELVSLMGNQWVGIPPPKSEIVFYLFLPLIWCRNFHDWTIPVGGDTWPGCLAER